MALGAQWGAAPRSDGSLGVEAVGWRSFDPDPVASKGTVVHRPGTHPSPTFETCSKHVNSSKVNFFSPSSVDTLGPH